MTDLRFEIQTVCQFEDFVNRPIKPDLCKKKNISDAFFWTLSSCLVQEETVKLHFQGQHKITKTKCHSFPIGGKITMSTNKKVIWQHVTFGCLGWGGSFGSDGGGNKRERELQCFEMWKMNQSKIVRHLIVTNKLKMKIKVVSSTLDSRSLTQ